MHRPLVTNRILAVTISAHREWMDEVGVIARREDPAKVNVPRMADMLAAAAEQNIEKATMQILKELAKNVPRRSRHWQWAHNEAERGLQDSIPQYQREIAGLLGQPEETMHRMVGQRFNAIKANAVASIYLHAAGWAAPEVEPWLKQNAYWISLAMSAAALAISGAANWDDISKLTGRDQELPHVSELKR